MSKCPTCFRPIPVSVEKYSCVGPCEQESPASLTKQFGHDVLVKPIFDFEVDACPKCRTASTVEACPVCHGVIPSEWRDLPAPNIKCVVMSGARTTGKSLYLGVLRQQLELFTERHGSLLTALGDTDRIYRERYGDALYVQRRILPPTVEVSRDPHAHQSLIFGIREHGGEQRILVLRDVAGEDLQDLKNRHPQLGFMARADAVIAMLDPLKIDELRRVLQGIVPVGELGGDGVQVLQNLLDLLRDAAGTQRSRVPLAVTLSKIDTVQRARDIEGSSLRPILVRAGSPLQRDPSMSAWNFDSRDADLLHYEIDALMRTVMGPKLANVLRQNSETFRYFAVSALGAAPDGDELDDSGIAPFRVLDPVKWILGV
ncbi:hypothetical protein BH09ACT11_BH09ACT11_06610 [soil metagenome]